MAATWTVGVDGSEHSAHALEWAAAHAGRHGAALEAVTTWSAPRSAMLMPRSGMNEALHEAEEHAVEILDEVLGRVAPDGGIDTHIELGTAAEVLLERSRERELLVVGSRGRGGFARLLLGSVSHQVATHATCPTVIVPGQAPVGEIGSVVVGMDGSENAIEALRWTLEFVPDDASVTVLGAWEPAMPLVEVDQAFFPVVIAEAQQRFDLAIDMVEAERGGDDRIERVFETADVRHTIARHATDAELLVVGARGAGLAGLAVLGSVSTWVLHHVECATAVIPHDDDERDADDDST